MPVVARHAIDALAHKERHEGFEDASQADEEHAAPKCQTMPRDERQQTPKRAAVGPGRWSCFRDAQFLTPTRARRLPVPPRFRADVLCLMPGLYERRCGAASNFARTVAPVPIATPSTAGVFRLTLSALTV